MDLRIKIKHSIPGVVTLFPVGRINSDTTVNLEQAIAEALADPVKTLVLDLTGVEFISSAGIGAIAKARAGFKKSGGDLAIVNPQPQIRKAFEIMTLLPSLNVFANTEELDEYLAKVQHRITGDDDT